VPSNHDAGSGAGPMPREDDGCVSLHADRALLSLSRSGSFVSHFLIDGFTYVISFQSARSKGR
jgi:hypothetical protein